MNVMTEENHIGEATKLLTSGCFPNLKMVLPGGPTRNDSTKAVPTEITDDDANVLFYDAVCPLVDHRIIQNFTDALGTYDAVDSVIASTDTTIKIISDNCISVTPVEAPCGGGRLPSFSGVVLERACRIAAEDPQFEATDDSSVVVNYLPETPIFVVKGSDASIKITEPSDIHREDIRRALNHAITARGRIDHVVLTAGIRHTGPFAQSMEDDLTDSIDTNLGAPNRIALESYPRLKASDGNRVNCINPSRTSTAMRTQAFESEDPGTLFNSRFVAQASAAVLASTGSGHAFDLRLPGNDHHPNLQEALP